MSEHASIRYHQNPLSAYENGCEMDLRLRLAVEFLKSPLYSAARDATGQTPSAAMLATNALELASSLFEQGEARGWVELLPDDSELPAGLRAHIERNVKAQMYQQMMANFFQAAAAPRVMTPPGANAPPNPRDAAGNVFEMPPQRAAARAVSDALNGEQLAFPLPPKDDTAE